MSPAKNPLAFLDDLKAQVKAKAKDTALAISKDKNEFVNREESRKFFLEQEKKTSLENCVAYEDELERFPEVQA